MTHADLHTHTSASDGVHPPATLVRMAADAGLAVVAITDHDTATGIDEALAAGREHGVTVVPGIELSCSWPERDDSLHIVGLFFATPPHPDGPLEQLLIKMRAARRTRAAAIAERLRQLGVDVAALSERIATDHQTALGRPHIARHLVTVGAVPTFDQAFDRFLLRGRPAYVPKPNLPPAAAIAAIHAAGGLAALAHPGLIRDFDAIWAMARDLPLDALEVYHPDHDRANRDRFRRLADEMGWGITGGSDFHGSASSSRKNLGVAGLTADEFARLRARGRQHQEITG